MAIQQLVPIYVNLKGDGSATAFVFALQNLYQFSNGAAIPFGGAGVVPTSVSVGESNFTGGTTTSSVDANGNITVTFGAAVASGAVVTVRLDLTFNSPAGTSSSATQTTNVTVVGSSTVTIGAGSAVIGHVIMDSGSTTVVTGTVTVSGTVAATQSGNWSTRTQDGAGNAITSNSTTTAAKFALDQNIISILGTAPTTAGFIDIKGADGNVFVRQTTGSNLHVQVDAGSAVIGHVITDSGSTTAVTGTVAVTQSTSPWVVSLTSTTITGTVAVTQSTSPWVVAGNLTHNAAVPGTANVGVLPAVASASAPVYNAGDQVLVSTDLSGNLRVGSGLIAPIVVQAGKTATANASTALANAFTSNNTLGNSIVVIVGIGNATVSTAFTSITDTLNTPSSNVYKLIAYSPNAAGTFATYIFLLTGCLAGANTVTINTTSSTVSSITYEVSGILATNNSIQINAATSATISSPLTFPIAVGDISFQAMAVGTAAQTITAGSGWTITQVNSPATPTNLFTTGAQFQTNIPMDGVLPTATLTSEPWTTAVVTFHAIPTLVPSALDTTSALAVNVEGRKFSYRGVARTGLASTTGLGNVNTASWPVATATPFNFPSITLSGSATKTVRITRVRITASAATAASLDAALLRYSSVTGGTSVTPSGGTSNLDINDPPATAGPLKAFTTNPTAATTVGGAIHSDRMSAVVAAANLMIVEWDFGQLPGVRSLVLRGTNDTVGIVFSAVGTTPDFDVVFEWTEE